jgi:hypothetical protein
MRQEHGYAIRFDLQRSNLTIVIDSVDLNEYVGVLPLKLRNYRIESYSR